MRESELFPPVKEWLESSGFEVFSEVQSPSNYGGQIDIVARKGLELVCIELKTSFTGRLATQVFLNQFYGRSYGAIPTKPRRKDRLEFFREKGCGLLRVTDTVEVIIPAQLVDSDLNPRCIEKMHKHLDVHEERGLAGTPTTKGVGPAIDCHRRILEFRKANPGATWKEIFQNVTNHYYSWQSMKSSMRLLEERKGME